MVKKAFLLLAVISVVIYCASMAKFLANSRNLTRQIPTLTVTSHAGLPTTTSTSSDANPNEISEMPRLFTTREPEIVDNQRPRIDVVFAIDSTGSMGDEIEVVKQNIRNIINDISQATPTPDVRYGIVTYRDHGDEYITRKWMLTRNVAQIVTALNSLVAGGGGDKEEAVAEALHVGLHEINWDQRASSKLVFLIGDAGPHRDQSSNNDQVGSIIDWQTELNFAEKQGISINTIACSGIEAHEMTAFQRMSEKTNGTFAHLTYKQEVVRSDGSRAVVLEEAGKTYEVAREAAADWERGATELVARQEAKVAASSVDDYVVSSPKDYSRDVPTRSADTAKPSLLNEVASSVGRLMTPSAAAPAAPPPAAAELADVSEVIVVKAEPSNRKADVAAPAKPMATQPLVGKTNNLHSILAGSIKQAARKQGATYGVAIAPLTTITGATSLVTSPRQILVDNATQLQELLAKPADVARVDFKHQVVVAIFLGQMANETTITVTNISLNKNELIVRYRRETTAVKGNFTPYQLVVLPRQVESTILTAKHIFLQVEEDK